MSGATVGEAIYRDTCGGVPGCKDRDVARRLLVGYQLSRIFAVEAGYHVLGTLHAPGSTVESKAYEGLLIGFLPLANKASMYAKLGGFRGSQVGTGERSEKIRTYNFPQNRITDHRINYTTHRLTEVLNGDLGELLDNVVTHYQSEKLRDATAVS